jgi:hypothetical protein
VHLKNNEKKPEPTIAQVINYTALAYIKIYKNINNSLALSEHLTHLA